MPCIITSVSKSMFMCLSEFKRAHCMFPADICYSPVYVYPHSKAVLMRAIQEDTQFLAQNAIMDYSLLTCIDDQTGELVVGIIGGCVYGGGGLDTILCRCVCVCVCVEKEGMEKHVYSTLA